MKWHVRYETTPYRYRSASVWSDELEDWDLTELDARRIMALAPRQTYEDSRHRVWTRA